MKFDAPVVWRNNAVKNECRTNSNVVEIIVEMEEKEQCRNIAEWILSKLKKWNTVEIDQNCLSTTKYLFLHLNIVWLKISANICNKLLQTLTIKNLEGKRWNKTHTHTHTNTHTHTSTHTDTQYYWQGWAKMLPTVDCVKVKNFLVFDVLVRL